VIIISASTYAESTLAVLRSVVETQHDAIVEAAEHMTDAIVSGRDIVAFGTGHSHLLVEELFYRAGGLVNVRPVFAPSLMLHEGPERSSAQERLHGLAATLLVDQDITEGDVVIVASNSGRNAVPVEFAQEARARGAFVIAITSLAHAGTVESRAQSGKKLDEVADVVIDNCGVPGDAIVPTRDGERRVAATSTVAGAFIVQSLVAEVIAIAEQRGSAIETLTSNNVDEF